VKYVIDVVELKDPDLSAQLAADEIAMALENRGSFRLAQKRVIRKVMRSGAKGIKTRVAGRLNGVDMARAEGYSHGVVPLATFRNDISYATAEAHTTYGIIGIKV
jgi:small subunit ribosomal protein S3